MRLYYYRDRAGNFGDDMNAWLWPRLLPEMRLGNDGAALSGIGTIINLRMPPAERWFVFGSGAGYGPPPPGFGGPGWEIIAVRGPLSARVLGLPAEAAVTDGAMLLALLDELQPVPAADRRGTLFVPHHYAAATGRWREVAERAGVEYHDPRGDSRAVIERIRTARLVVADAMHGAIVADTVRVPWVPVTTSKRSHTFKWLDWTSSMRVPYEPTALPPSRVLDRIQNITMRLYGDNYALATPTPEAAVTQYLGQSALRSRPWWPSYAKRARRLFTGAPKRLLSYPVLSFLARDDERLMDRAAVALRGLAGQEGYLSDERCFDEQRGRMDAGLARLRSLLRASG